MSKSTNNFTQQLLNKTSIDTRTALIQNANLTDLIELFRWACQSNAQTELTDLRGTTLQKICELENSEKLTSDQINQFTTVSLQILSNKTNTIEPELQTSLLNLLEKHVNKENVAELVAFALENHFEKLLTHCFNLLKSETNVDFNCNNFESIIIKFQDSNFQSLRRILPELKNRLNNSNIQIEIAPSAATDFEILKAFVIENGSLITSSDYRSLKLDEESLEFLLKNTLNLHSLFIESNKINGDGIGLQQLKNLAHLQSLNICGCTSMTSPPDLSGNPNLQSLNMSWCSSMKSPPDLSNNPNLQSLDMCECYSMEIPPDLSQNPNLHTLNMSWCSLMESPPNISHNPNLQILDMSHCESITNPPDLSGDPNLQSLNMSVCSSIKSAPDVSKNPNLQSLNICGYSSIESPPDLSKNLNLQRLNMSWCSSLESPPDLSQNPNLKFLDMSYCESMKKPPLLSCNPNLQVLDMSECKSMRSAPDLSHNPNLQSLNINECTSMKSLPNLCDNSNLQNLNISGCRHMTNPPDLSGNPNLQILDMSYCKSMSSPPDLSHNPNLQILNMRGCSLMESPPDISFETKLQNLNMSECSSMSSPPDLSLNKNLQSLDMSGCYEMASPPDVSGEVLRRFCTIALRFPEVIDRDDFGLLFEDHGAIFDIIKLSPGTKEDLKPKIERFLKYIEDKPTLHGLLFEKISALKKEHQSVKIPLLQFYAYTAGLISSFSKETVKSYFSENEMRNSSSNLEKTASKQSLFELILSYKFAPHRYDFLLGIVQMIDRNISINNISSWTNRWTQLSVLTLVPYINIDNATSINNILVAIDKRTEFQDEVFLNTLISFLLEMSRIVSPEDSKIILTMINDKLNSTNKTSALLKEFQAYENLSKLYGKEALLDTIP